MLGFIVIVMLVALTVFVLGSWFEMRRASRCPKYRYIYRPYVRTFIEEQTQPTSVFKLFKDMFWSEGPWVTTHANPQEKSTGRINPYVWGALPKTDLGTERESHDFLNADYS